MLVKSQRIFKFLLLLIIMVGFNSILSHPAYAEENKPKALIFIIDRIDWNDISRENTPNLKKLIDNNGIGLMNSKSKNIYMSNNLLSPYLSINMSIKENAPDNSGYVKGVGEGLQVTDFNRIKSSVSNDKVGLLGKLARENHLQVALVGFSNNNRQNQPAALLAMDEKGFIPLSTLIKGNVNNNDLDFIKAVKNTMHKADIIFIDFGDAASYNKGALAKVDRSIGELSENSGSELLLFMSPNISTKMLKQYNFSLTPFIMANGNRDKGLIVSDSTRREGLITNIDVAPTIFNYFHIKNKSFAGEPVQIKKAGNTLNYVQGILRLTINLNIIRYINYGFYLVVSFIVLTILFKPQYRQLAQKNWVRTLSLALLMSPLASVLLPATLGQLIFHLSWLIYLTLILLVTVIPSYLTAKVKKYDMITKIGVITGLTTFLFFIEAFTSFKHLLYSPFGYNDLMIGGRYYGINNDAMALFISAVVISFFIWREKFKPSFWLSLGSAIILLGLLIMSFSPVCGANVGGSITAIAASVFIFIILIDRKLTIRRFIIILIFVFLIQVGLATIDATFNSHLTHAGKAIQTILNKGWAGFIDILKSKLYQLFLMIIVPPWNLLVAYQIFLLIKQRQLLNIINQHHPDLRKAYDVLIYASMVGFAFKDTGVIVAGLMLIYLMITLGYSLPEHNSQ